MTDSAEWELSSGANLLDQNHAQFRLWAPAQTEVSLVIAGRQPLQMASAADGWFETKAECKAGTKYHYVLQDGTAVPDPVSRGQCGDVHGESIVVDPRSYRWRETNWRGRPWHEAVIYELHVGAYGGFSGVVRELSRLADLGITAIELMPIAEFPGARNWGYDGVLPFAPECSYGSPDELKTLVDAAHARGMMIFLDVVYNHFGPDGNYLSLYAPQMFRDDITTRGDHRSIFAAARFAVTLRATRSIGSWNIASMVYGSTQSMPSQSRIGSTKWLPRSAQLLDRSGTFIWCWRTITMRPII